MRECLYSATLVTHHGTTPHHRTLSMLIDDFEITLRRYKRMHSMEQRKAGLHELREVYKAAPDAQDPVVVLQLLRQYVYNRTEQLSAA